MPKFAANLSVLFAELPLLHRFAAAAKAGFGGAELPFPYDLATKDMTRAMKAHGLEFVVMNAPPPNWTNRPRGFAAVPGGEAQFQRDFERAARFARALGARHLQLMCGIASGPEADQTLIRNLIWAADQAPDLSLTIKPKNTGDMPGYFLNSFDLAARIIGQVGAPNLGLQFDSYHAQAITGDALACWRQHRGLVRHVQIAGFPGRDEPDRGSLDLARFLAGVKADGYDGWIGADYTPAGTTAEGLGWLSAAQSRR